MSKQAFQEEFEKILEEELNQKKPVDSNDLDDFGLPLKKIDNSKEDDQHKPNSKPTSAKINYKEIKDKILKEDSEMLKNIKFRKKYYEQEVDNEKAKQSQKADFNNHFDPLESNQDLADFFESQEKQNFHNKSNKGVLISPVLLFLALAFFSFSLFSLYTSVKQEVDKYHQLCLADLSQVRIETIQNLDLECEKVRTIRAILDRDLISENYFFNKRIIENLNPSDFISNQAEFEGKINDLLELLTTAGVENLPDPNTTSENAEQVLVELQKILAQTELETIEKRDKLANLVLTLDTLEIQEYEDFYQNIKNLSGQNLVAKRLEIKDKTSSLEGLVLEQKGSEFLENINSFGFLDKASVKIILQSAEFENLQPHIPAVFSQEASNNKILELAQEEGYTNFGVAITTVLNNQNLQPKAALAWQELTAKLESEISSTLRINSSYTNPTILDKQFLETFQQISKEQNQEAISEAQIQESMADEILLKTLEKNLPGGLNPKSTGYAITLTNLSEEQQNWLSQNNFYNLKLTGFIPILSSLDAEEQTFNNPQSTNNLPKSENKLTIIFIPNLLEIFTNQN